MKIPMNKFMDSHVMKGARQVFGNVGQHIKANYRPYMIGGGAAITALNARGVMHSQHEANRLIKKGDRWGASNYAYHGAENVLGVATGAALLYGGIRGKSAEHAMDIAGKITHRLHVV